MFERSYTLFEKILASLNEAVFVVTPKTRKIEDCNITAEKIFGYGREEIIGRDTAILHVNDGMFEAFGREALKAYEGKECFETEYKMKRKSGEIFPTEHFVQPIFDENGEIEHVVSVVRDITGRKRAEEQIEILHTDLACRAFELETANRELEAFSYSVSHDLRSPLANINGLTQALLELCGDRLDGQCTGFIRDIGDETLRMAQLIDTLLNFSRLARSEMERETVDLSGMARTIAAELRMKEPKRRATFTIAEGMVVDGDARLLRVALENLLGNAWKYSGRKEHADIEFGTLLMGGKPAYFIRDNGTGFDMAFADTLFAPFHRLHKRSEFEGHGIGLATVERIIRRHGGRVWAEGEVGKGAVFYFTL